MARRRNFGGFSWKRLTGVTRAKQRLSRSTGIPLSRSGRQRKLGKAAGGCLVSFLVIAILGISPAFGQYILNTETNKVHLPTCRTIQKGNDVGKSTVKGGANFVPVTTTDGHDICKVCMPKGKTPEPVARQVTPITTKPAPASTVIESVPESVKPAQTPAPVKPAFSSGIPTVPSIPVNRVVPKSKVKPPVEWGWVKVKRVVDGDTIVLENGKIVRLTGCDTPETVKPNTPVQPYGKEAAEYTKEFIESAENWVFLEQDGDIEDRYGRQLAIVYIKLPYYDSSSEESKIYILNEALIWEGLAKAGTQYKYSKEMKDKFIQSEKDARECEVGIWSQAL